MLQSRDVALVADATQQPCCHLEQLRVVVLEHLSDECHSLWIAAPSQCPRRHQFQPQIVCRFEPIAQCGAVADRFDLVQALGSMDVTMRIVA